ncbi:MAG: nuclear transport factor 2 family protein [Alphaproteobacteria bacterium]|nr:nuclear transport factor 2 family protein [Alphaproteobacteria bacterium]MBU1513531.1 nuclear transport factor 2 family protein [Alphaproteobacteria bacterium]MBU2094824.1 nuclear transport factor 2 family protein [Alphaproteobacteria bacterium]MBU2151081.1 nuclear transport factor 2 family protein [Alphaproteobacteria bacterium]MBU2309364.1 nuclear transport factor 2 family protein [Alphaproteobacteria bacterium]
MPAPDDAIRARRRLTNKLIAAHEAERLRPFFLADVTLIVGDGGLILGVDAVIAAFAAQFADPDFKTYIRETETVRLDAEGARAAEAGRWTGLYADAELSGTYLATWRNVRGQWAIENELYVTLS